MLELLARRWQLVVLRGVVAVLFGHDGTDRVYLVTLGILGVVAGLISLIWPAITVIVLLVVIAVWAIVAGITQIAAAVRLREVIRNEWFLALSGAVALVLGLLLIVQPGEGAIALLVAIATFALVWGLTLIVLGFRLRSLRGATAGRRA